jgi:hypothetical protein
VLFSCVPMKGQTITIKFYETKKPKKSVKLLGSYASISDATSALLDRYNLEDMDEFTAHMWTKSPLRVLDKLYDIYVEVEQDATEH